MKVVKWFLAILGVFLFLIVLIIGIVVIKKNPTGIGVSKGVCLSSNCKECHPQHYKEWQAGQQAAFTAMKEIFLADQAAEFAGPLCWKCHDPYKQGIEEGVTCEYCHGKTDCKKELHDQVRKASIQRLKDDNFCHKCHSVIQPITKADLQGTVREWEESKARKEGLNCQDCHMPLIGEGEDKHHFHGHYYPGRNPIPGRNSIAIEDVVMENGQIEIFVKNHVSSHYFPTGAHTKAIVLAVTGFDENTKPVFEDTYLFIKRFEFKKFLRIQNFPYSVNKDTRLKPEEERKIAFNVDKSVNIKMVKATLRCGFVGDHGFDLEHWTSDYISEKEFVVTDHEEITEDIVLHQQEEVNKHDAS